MPCGIMILGSLALGINLQGGQKTSKKKIGRNFPLAKRGKLRISNWGLAAEGEALTILGVDRVGGRGGSPYVSQTGARSQVQNRDQNLGQRLLRSSI